MLAPLSDFLGVSQDPIASSDIVVDSHASIADLQMTRVVDRTLAKVMSWYDKKWVFTHQMVRPARRLLVHQP